MGVTLQALAGRAKAHGMAVRHQQHEAVAAEGPQLQPGRLLTDPARASRFGERLTAPLTEPAAINARLDAVSFFVDETRLREALRVASASHDQQLVARAWPSLIYALMLQDKLDAAEALAFSADLAIVQSGDELARAWLLNNLGTLYGDKGDYTRARKYFQEALELKIRITSPTDFDVGISWNNLGFALTFDKRWVQANDAFDQALAIFEATVGPLHPNSGIARSGQCNVAVARKRYKEALLRCNSALGLLEASQSSPALIGRVQIKVAKSLRGLGRYEEALVVAREALARRGNDSELSQQITKWIKDTEAQARAREAERLEHPPSPDETETKTETKAETEEVNP